MFAGTFTAGGLEVEIQDNKLKIIQEGKNNKFVRQVEHITFSGKFAVEMKQPILYVTERCVFELSKKGFELIEVAPGIDIENDILAHMDFEPIMDHVSLMDERIFVQESMNLKTSLVDAPISHRIQLDKNRNQLSVNMRGYKVNTERDMELIRLRVEELCKPLKQQVDVIAWYDGFSLNPNMRDACNDMVAELESKYYKTSVRYIRDPFLRLKLVDELQKRGIEAQLRKDSVCCNLVVENSHSESEHDKKLTTNITSVRGV